MENKFSVFQNIRKHANMVGVNMITLNFFDKNIETSFRNEYFKKSLIAFRISFITVILLYSAFGYLDITTSAIFYKSFFVIRYLIVLPVLLGVFLFSFHSYFEKIWQVLISICFVVGGSGIIYMLLKNPENVFYYGGMMLIFMAGYFFIKLRFFAAMIPGILLVILYNIGTFSFHSLYNIHFNYLVSINAFYVSANIISLIALYNIEFLERKDFYQRKLLIEKQNEISLINQSLEIKVNERTKSLDERNANLLNEIKNRRIIERKLITTKEKAEESDRLKSAFLANMSHEIRTPMNGILGYAELLKEPKLSGTEKEKYLSVIESSGIRLLNTVNDLIDFSKIEAGQMNITASKVNINELIEQVYTFFNVEAQKKELQLVLDPTYLTKNIHLHSDQDKIYSILTNLIKNAIKYSPSGRIEIGYILKKDTEPVEVEFFVKDSGIGIPKEKLEVIFDRFIRVGNDEEFFSEGSGLGLSISKAYAEMLGGKIRVESEVGVGSQFYFTIPYKKTENEVSSTKEANSEAKPQTNPEVSGLKILIAEDDKTADDLLSILLKDISKEIIHAKSGIRALELCRNNPDIDIILMDINMPEMNGYEATRQIREFNKDVIIIAQTAYALAGDHEKSMDAGCDDYISKPINKKDLLEKIENCLSKK